MKRAWDIQVGKNWWLSLGFHFDHTDPSITLHLPFIIIALGNLKQPGFKYSIILMIKNLINKFIFIFSKPKYKLHTHIYYPHSEINWQMICDIKRNWKYCLWFYKLSEIEYWNSEGVINFYQKDRPHPLYGNKNE